SSSKPKVEVHEHTDAVLACEFRTEKDQNPRIEWKKKGKGVTFVYFNDKFTGSYAGRAKIEGATLTIHSVTQKDSGEYRCEVTASEDHVNLGEASVSLNVLVPPHVPSCEVPSSVFVGSGLELLCKDKLSVPPATYRWYKDNKALTATADTPYNIDTNKGTLVSKICKYSCKPTCRHTAVTLLTSSLILCLFVWSRSLRVCLNWTQGCTAVSPPTVWGHPKAVWPRSSKLLTVSGSNKSTVSNWCLHISLYPQKQNNLSPLLSDPLNMTILIAGAAGFLLLILFCCICVCVCRRRGCCKSE
uniref:Ig-like domain-containing protein n=1 Tax=Anabas testudineus TaxID=64144 RepID=A0A7N6BBZ0_ANATE